MDTKIFKLQKNEKIRCFVIADDYRWLILTDDINEYHQASLAYLNLMNSSKKENKYYFKNIFLDKKEFQQIKNQMSVKHQAPVIQRPKSHLSLVD